MANLSKKDIIKNLYHDKKLSSAEIAKELDTTSSAILSFMHRNNIPRRTMSEANAVSFQNKPATFLVKRNLSIKEEKLKLAGVMLYWAEGAKAAGKNCTVDFANSNPKMVKIFVKFLKEICRVDERRLRVFLYCYSDQNIENILNYWYKLTDIPKNQFTKPYIRNDFLTEKSGKMQYGLVHIRYYDKKLLIQIDNWIKEFCEVLINGQMVE